MNPAQFKEGLVGPIASLPTFFSRQGAQDLASVQGTVEFAIVNGLKILLLTAGDSSYALQTETEIRALARAVIEQAAGRAIVIVGTGRLWWRDQISGFARYVQEVGGDAVMVLRPEPCLGDGPAFEDATFETYQAVAGSVDCGIVLNGVFSMRLLERLAQIPNVVGLKEDAGDPWCHDALWHVGKELAIFNGGQNWRYLYSMLWGATAYMDTYAPWAPQVTQRFWDAVQQKDLFAAAQLVDQYENPFFDFASSHPKGYHPVQQATFEIFGRGPRWMRPPQPSLGDREMDELRAVFEKTGLL